MYQKNLENTDVLGGKMTRIQNLRKFNFEKTLGKTQKDFFLYCAVQCYYQEPITEKKLKNHFDDDMITKAKKLEIIKPWGEGYYFEGLRFVRDNYNLKEMIDWANKKYSMTLLEEDSDIGYIMYDNKICYFHKGAFCLYTGGKGRIIIDISENEINFLRRIIPYGSSYNNDIMEFPSELLHLLDTTN